jgi:hypothetical protein
MMTITEIHKVFYETLSITRLTENKKACIRDIH